MGNREQTALWNEAVGSAWVRHADHFDATLAPFGHAALRRLDVGVRDHVLDLGCGTGSTSVLLAGRAGRGLVLGVDVSDPMLAEARRRVALAGVTNVRFLHADVQTTVLPPATFDSAYSRFGVMFFEDPVAAFANVGHALKPGGRLAFVCFQGPAANPFIVVPVLAAARLLGMPPMPGPTEPGPFSLADPQRITTVLEAAGFTGVEIEAGPAEAVLDDAHDLTTVARRVVEQNPATAVALAAAPPDTAAAAVEATARALGEHRVGGVVRMGAGTWLVRAARA